jgi:hypothetical protein
MAFKILLIVAAFVAFLATTQMVKRSRTVYVRPMGYVPVSTRRTNLALVLYGLAIVLAAIGWVTCS